MGGPNQTLYFGQSAKLSPSLFFSQSLAKNPLIVSCLNFICLFELLLPDIKKLGGKRILKAVLLPQAWFILVISILSDPV